MADHFNQKFIIGFIVVIKNMSSRKKNEEDMKRNKIEIYMKVKKESIRDIFITFKSHL